MTSSRRLGRRRVLRGGTLLVAGLLSVTPLTLSSCRKAPPAPLTKPAPLPDRPPEVVAELVLPTPHELWPRFRTLAGPIGDVLPSSPELALAAIASVPPLGAGSLDVRSPIAIAWLGGDAPGLVVGVHVESGPELVAQVASGSHPTHRVDRRGGVAYLSQASGAGFSFAVVSDTLLLGPERAVERAGEYVARALRPRAPTQGPVVVDFIGPSLKAWLVPRLSAAWAEQRAALVEALGREQSRKGRPADLADPAALLGALDGVVRDALGVVGSARGAHAEISTASERLTLSLRVEADGALRALLAALRPGPADRLRELPPGAALALFRRRTSDTSTNGFVRALFGPRLSAADAARLDRALDRLRAGRGDAEAFALMPDLGLVWRGDVNDATELRAAFADLVPFLARPPFADALSESVGRPSLGRRPVERRGDDTVERSLIRMMPKSGGPSAAKNYELTTFVGTKRFVAAFGKSSSTVADAAIAAEAAPEARLGGAPPFASQLSATGDVAWLLVTDLTRLGLAPADVNAVASIEAGVGDGALTVTLRATDGAVRALAAREFGR
ncbi:MAG TPA: hypothetical protein VFQ35_14620 [Polyangiaceae bacterium]|nr:hypothetical protein [Polyangiaceae bacterium]